MLGKSCIFHLLLLCRNVSSSDAGIVGKAGDTTNNYTVEVGFSKASDDGKTRFVYCNGGLMADNLILTLASCVMDEAYRMQTPFLAQITSDGEVFLLPQSQLQAIYAPSSFNATTSRDDIALLKLSAPLSKTKRFQTLEIALGAAGAADRARVSSKGWLRYFLAKPNYEVTAGIDIVDDDQCREAYPGLADNGTLCARFDATSRPANSTRVLAGSVGVVGARGLVGLLSSERDLSVEADDVQRYTDVRRHAGFVSRAAVNDTRGMHYCVNRRSYLRGANRPIWTCADSWE